MPSDRRRVLRRVANPLELGTQHDAPFVLDGRWKERLDQRLAARRELHGDGPLTVGLLRELLDGQQPAGLTVPVGNLVILTYAAQTGRTFRLHGGEPGTIGGRSPRRRAHARVRPAARRRRVGHGRAARGVRVRAGERQPAPQPDERRGARRPVAHDCRAVAGSEQRPRARARGAAGVGRGGARRCRALRTAQAAAELATAVAGAAGAVEAVEALAAAEVPTSEQALGGGLSSAAALLTALRDPRWDLLETALPGLPAERETLRNAFEQDEFATSLSGAIDVAYRAAVRATRKPPPPPAAATRAASRPTSPSTRRARSWVSSPRTR